MTRQLLLDKGLELFGTKGYAATTIDDIAVAVPTGQMEGAAGSSYYTAPVSITATDQDGRPIGFDGEMVLRRVNDVPGSTAEQRRWHIESTTIDWTH